VILAMGKEISDPYLFSPFLDNRKHNNSENSVIDDRIDIIQGGKKPHFLFLFALERKNSFSLPFNKKKQKKKKKKKKKKNKTIKKRGGACL